MFAAVAFLVVYGSVLAADSDGDAAPTVVEMKIVMLPVLSALLLFATGEVVTPVPGLSVAITPTAVVGVCFG